MSTRTKKIALIGMFGGFYRGEYNPGCFMICLKTYQELKKRIEDCEIDIYAVDNVTKEDKLSKEQLYGLEINFFPASQGVSLLNSVFSEYDALVIGGDVIWSDYFERNCKLFFLNSEPFLASEKPKVLYNCVHRFTPVEKSKDLFMNMSKRSDYLSVRTSYLKNQLNEIGVSNINAIPDPVLDLELRKVEKKGNKKPLIGISIAHKFFDSLILLLHNTDLSAYDVCFYPYSRQYDNLATIEKVKSIFGDQFSYIMDYKDPVESFELIGSFDLSVNDTYHGTIAALTQNVPFICFNTEPPASSRVTHLLKPFDLQDQLVSAYPEPGENDTDTFNRCLREFKALINKPAKVSHAHMQDVKKVIQGHFDDMAAIIKES